MTSQPEGFFDQRYTKTTLSSFCDNITPNPLNINEIGSKENHPVISSVRGASKIRINEVKYDAPGEDTSDDEYIELYVVDGNFDPSFWYVTDWAYDNYWKIPDSCPMVSTGEFIIIHLGTGTNINTGPIYHYFMGETFSQLNNGGEPLTLLEDSDLIHDMENDIAHDFVAYGWVSECPELTTAIPWCNWLNDGFIPETIELTEAEYESLQLLGNDLDNSSNWWSSKPTEGEVNELFHQYIEDFIDSSYKNEETTSVNGWGNGNITIPPKGGEMVTFQNLSSPPYDVFVLGNYAYVAGGNPLELYLAILDITDPKNPTQLSSISKSYQECQGVYC